MVIRKFVLLQIALVFTFNALGQYVSSEQAEEVGINWLRKVSNFNGFSAEPDSLYTVSENNTPVYYVITTKPVGWVMVSASQKAEPIIGYSITSLYRPDVLPREFELWMNGVQNNLYKRISNSEYNNPDILPQWQALSIGELSLKSQKKIQTVGPLITSSWDQGEFFNEMTPYDPLATTGNNHTWLGCLATVMAQIMNYWEYPANGAGEHSYSHEKYGDLSADFENTFYNWGDMPDELDTVNQSVQQICYQAAVAIDMIFGPYYSGAYLEDVEKAFVDYFRYNSSLFTSERRDWETDDWLALMRSELDNGHPIIYGGYCAGLNNGHGFICDGYSDDFFHFNWGWGGIADGYFTLSNLSPQDCNYSYSQKGMFGIAPVIKQELIYPYFEQFDQELNCRFSFAGVYDFSDSVYHSGIGSLCLSEQGMSSIAKNTATLAFKVASDSKLSFWVKRRTPKTTDRNSHGAFLLPEYGEEPLEVFFNGKYNDDEWVNFKADLSEYEGLTVRLQFVQNNGDFFRDQWMNIDDVVVTSGVQNLDPFKPLLPTPQIGASGVPLNTELKWLGGDPNGDSVTYQVYLGTTTSPPFWKETTSNSISVEGLEHTKPYYWRVAASDGEFEVTGDVWSFTTQKIPPAMQLCGLKNITSETAQVCGSVANNNGSEVYSIGICYATQPMPTLDDYYTEVPIDENSPYYMLKNLKPFTKYYVRSFANSSEGTGFSNQDSFVTQPALADLSVLRADSVRRNDAQLYGLLEAINDDSISSIGAVWSKESSFDPENAHTVESGVLINRDTLYVELDELDGPDSVFVRLFVDNSVGRSYSDQFVFVTQNKRPFLDLDGNNSSYNYYNGFNGKVHEQTNDGYLVDVDFKIIDTDNDFITAVKFILADQGDDATEYLYVDSIPEGLLVENNFSDTLLVIASIRLPDSIWIQGLKAVRLWIGSDAPQISKKRVIKVTASDGVDESNMVTANLVVVKVNDAPVVEQMPLVSGEALFGNTLAVVAGKWTDALDGVGTCSFEFQHRWQLRFGDEVVELDRVCDTITIDDEMCGAYIRVVETAFDYGCGGVDTVTNVVYGDWKSIEKKSQSINFKTPPELEFSTEPYVITGESSSGLPLTYEFKTDELGTFIGDSLFLSSVGSELVVAQQRGNSCYLPSEKKQRILTVRKGSQEIIIESPDSVTFDMHTIPLLTYATSGLPLLVASSDSLIAYASSDSVFIQGVGLVDFTFAQPGNENFEAASSVIFKLEVGKGNQQISVMQNGELKYGQDARIEFRTNSALDIDVVSLNENVLAFNSSETNINGVGLVEVQVSNSGNELWNACSEKIVFEIAKGDRDIVLKDTLQKQFGDDMFLLDYESKTSVESFDLSIANEHVAVAVNDSVLLIGVGQTDIEFSIAENELWNSFVDTLLLIVGKGEQKITFDTTLNIVYADTVVMLSYFINSGLKVDFVSSVNDVATIRNDSLVIHNSGTTIITANQPGNENWGKADSEKCVVNVSKAEQHITTVLEEVLTTGDDIFYADFVVSSGLPVSEIISSDNGVIRVENGNLDIVNKGDVVLEVVQNGDRNFNKTSTLFAFHVTYPDGLNVFEATLFSLYPNPASEQVMLILPASETEFEFELVNSQGQVMMSEKILGESKWIEVTALPSGIYFVQVSCAQGFTTQKLIIR